jgi:hypothetical protein
MKGIKREKSPGITDSQYGRELTVAIVVRRTPLNKTLVYPSCMRTKVKTAIQSSPARNWAMQTLDETYLFRRQGMILSKSL